MTENVQNQNPERSQEQPQQQQTENQQQSDSAFSGKLNTISEAYNPTSRPSKNTLGKFIKAVSFLIIFLVSLSGGYFYVYPSVFASPARVLGSAKTNYFERGAQTYNGFFLVDRRDEAEGFNFLINIQGSVVEGVEERKSAHLFTIDNAKLSSFPDTNLKGLGLETRAIDDQRYVRLLSAPGLVLENPILNIMKNILIDQWFDISSTISSSDLTQGGETVEQIQRGISFTDTIRYRPEIASLIPSKKFIKGAARLDDARINNVLTYQYQIDFDENALRGFLDEAQIVLTSEGEDAQQVKNFLEVANSIKLNPFHVWIGKVDKELYKISGSFIATGEGGANTSEVVLELTFNDINKARDIQAPKNTKTISGIIPAFLTGSALGADTDEDGLVDILEDVYGTDPENPDTDGDGFSDGMEVQNGYNPNGSGPLVSPVE